MSIALRLALASLALAPFVQAQHTVNLGPNWVINSCVATPPQSNSDSTVVFGANAHVTADADHSDCSITGIAMSLANVFAGAQTSATSQIQCSYSRPGLGALITCAGSHSASGSASTGGFVLGEFACDASYSNSVGVNVNPSASYAGGSISLTPSGSFSVATLATNFSYSTLQACSVRARTFGVGSSLLMAASANVDSITNL